MNPFFAMLGIAVGTASTTIGASGLAMLLFGAGMKLQKSDRVSIGAATLGLVGVGTALTAVSSYQLTEMRKGRA